MRVKRTVCNFPQKPAEIIEDLPLMGTEPAVVNPVTNSVRLRGLEAELLTQVGQAVTFTSREDWREARDMYEESLKTILRIQWALLDIRAEGV